MVEVLEFAIADGWIWEIFDRFAIDAWFEKKGSRLFIDFVLHPDTFSVLVYFNVRLHHSHNTRQEIPSVFPPFPLFSAPYTFLYLVSRPFFSFLFYTHTHDDKTLSTESLPPLAPDDASINWLGAAGMGSRAQMTLCKHSDPFLFCNFFFFFFPANANAIGNPDLWEDEWKHPQLYS